LLLGGGAAPTVISEEIDLLGEYQPILSLLGSDVQAHSFSGMSGGLSLTGTSQTEESLTGEDDDVSLEGRAK